MGQSSFEYMEAEKLEVDKVQELEMETDEGMDLDRMQE